MFTPTRVPVPPDAEEIHPGYWLTAQQGYEGQWTFYLYFNDQRKIIATVNLPLTQTYRSRDHTPDAAMIRPRISTEGIPDEVATAIGSSLMVSACFATVLNECYDEELEQQQREHDQFMRELKLSKQRDAEQFEQLYQQVIWMVGSKFRLRRRGKKATVFGTIDYVTPPREDGTAPPGAYMNTTSEKGVPMHIRLRDVIKMEIKQDNSSRRYDLIYEEKLKGE